MMISRRGHLSAGLLLCLCALICSAAYAAPIGTPLPPGTTVPVGVLSPPPGTLLASDTTPFSYATGGNPPRPNNVGQLIQAVFLRDGTLDFYYQIVLTSGPENINNVDNTVFSGFTTDVFSRPDGGAGPLALFQAGGVAPGLNGATRNTLGSQVQWNFVPLLGFGPITPGSHSQILVISTDARNFDEHGVVGLVGGGSPPSLSAFEPAPGVFQTPEPASMALLGVGLLALGIVRKVRRA